MSNGNGTFDYTLEEQATLLAQFTKSGTLINERKRPFDTVSRSLQAIIADDSVIQITPKVIADAGDGKVLHVTGDYDSAALALDAGEYNDRYGFSENAKQIAKVPMIVQPVDRKVRISPPLGRYVKTSEMFGLYPKMTDPMTLFTLGAKFPKEQLDGPIFVVWKDHAGQFWCAILGGFGSRRRVNVRRVSPDGKWDDGYRVLLCE